LANLTLDSENKFGKLMAKVSDTLQLRPWQKVMLIGCSRLFSRPTLTRHLCVQTHPRGQYYSMNDDLIRDSSTSATLLCRLRDPTDEEAWCQFVRVYGPRVYVWAKSRLQSADAEDVTQVVLMKLASALRTFQYDKQKGSFRAYLKTATRRAISDIKKALPMVDEQSLVAVQTLIEDEFDLEILREAESRVQRRVKRATWQVYEFYVKQQQSAAAVAKQLDLPIASVYTYKRRVLTMLQEEVQRLLKAVEE
jgi:RNA polymerase sigma-70 factor, ECF subfamily